MSLGRRRKREKLWVPDFSRVSVTKAELLTLRHTWTNLLFPHPFPLNQNSVLSRERGLGSSYLCSFYLR